MRQRRTVFAALAASLCLVAGAQTVRTDANVRIGKLRNGLTYYIRYNNRPENRADFYIAQRVGSVNEEENQRGLAHFLEHMCFNGTEHFPGNSVTAYMETLGVKFGADLNAYTATDETVYRICNVPTERQSALDSCLLVLRDWSHGLLLDEEETDRERGVIESEWRMRSGAAYRMLERAAPTMFPGSRYGHRMPMGRMDVVRNFAHDDLRSYYRKWYHPANQAIVVVGNVDIDHTERTIRRMFAPIKTPRGAAVPERYGVPDNEDIVCAVESDPEQATRLLTIYFKHDGPTADETATEAFFRNDYVRSVVRMMVGERLGDMARRGTAPFTSVSVHDESFSVAGSKEAFALRAVVKRDSTEAAARVLAREVARLHRHGFTRTEYERAARKARALIDDYYANRDRRTNREFAQEYIRNFTDGEPLPSADDYMEIIGRVERATTTADADRYVAENISRTGRNVVITAFCPAKDGEPLPTADAIVSAFREGRAEETAPYEDGEIHGAILDTDPEPGKIVAEEELDRFGAKVWTLGNGARVYLRHSAAVPNEIRISATSPGGYSLNYTPERAASLKMINDVTAAGAWGRYKRDELEKMLAGTRVSVVPFVELTEEGINASATPDDIDTAMQLIHLKMTRIGRDDEAFGNLIEARRNAIENHCRNPRTEMADSIFRHVYSHHPLAARLTADELEDVSYDDIIGIYRDRFADASDFAFYITGNYDEQRLRTLTERYIASLPATWRGEKAVDVGYHMARQPASVWFSRDMETPQSVVYVYRDGEAEYTPRTVVTARMLGSALANIYRREIREEKGWAYAIRTHCSIVADVNAGDRPHFNMPLNCPIEPGHEQECLDIVNARLRDIAENGLPADEMESVRRHAVKSARDGMDDNGYWASVLRQYHKYGLDFYNGYIETIEGVTADDIRRFVNDVVLRGNTVELIMTPVK